LKSPAFGRLGASGDPGQISNCFSEPLYEQPYDIVINGDGNLIISDYRNNRLRLLRLSDSFVTTFAGHGPEVAWLGGDVDGDALSEARLYNPAGIEAVETDYGLDYYFADSHNHKIKRKDSKTGEVYTYAGTGENGDVDGPKMDAMFRSPKDIAFDSRNGNLYVADTSNHLVRLIEPDGMVSTFAQVGEYPRAVLLDEDNNLLYVAHATGDIGYNSYRISKIDLTTKVVSGIAGLGDENSPYTLCSGYNPQDRCRDGSKEGSTVNLILGMTLDDEGNLYFADWRYNRIRKIDFSNPEDSLEYLTTVAGNGEEKLLNGQGTSTSFNHPSGIVYDSVNNVFYIADSHNHVIRKYNPSNTRVRTVSGESQGGMADCSCGNNRCDVNEEFYTCVQDCHEDSCGNGICDADYGEDYLNCAGDCDGGGGEESCPNGKPGQENTGSITPESQLQTYTGSYTITQSGAVLEGYKFNYTLTIKANNVVIRNFVIDANGANYGINANFGYKNLLAEDGEIRNAASSGVLASEITLRRIDIHDMAADGLKVRGNSLVEGVWVHHPIGTAVGSHPDAEQMRSGSNTVFRCNNFDIPYGVPGTGSNSCFILGADVGVIDNILIENNWCNGGNYAVNLLNSTYGCTTNVKLKNNRFGRDFQYGLLSTFCSQYSCGNVWDNTGESVNNGDPGGFDQDDEVCGGEVCNNWVDDDNDSLIDCADIDCDGKLGPNGETCEYGSELTCNDGWDNDRDGKIDCADPDCAGSPYCNPECSDSIDNDGDGWVDFPADPGCISQADPLEVNNNTGFACSDSIDNDFDGFIDGYDPGCTSWNDPSE